MEAFAVSAGLVALGEIGDKTQLLTLVLAARFKRPLAIVAGILVATLANHAAAAWVGNLVAQWLTPTLLRLVIGGSFLLMAGWVLIPDAADGDAVGDSGRLGVFGTTVLAFFLAEMGDKTQIVTVALAARYVDLTAVVLGTTLGMLAANAPVVWLGDRVARRLPMRLVHRIAAALFALFGLATILG